MSEEERLLVPCCLASLDPNYSQTVLIKSLFVSLFLASYWQIHINLTHFY